MLKIKDEIDLKELEKFGFYKSLKIYQKDLVEEWNMTIPMSDIISCIYIKTEDRIIRLANHFKPIENTKLETLYDLIQAGYVEKVQDNV